MPELPAIGAAARGIGWPLAFDERGTVVLQAGPDYLETSVRAVLATEPGDRPMRSDFGCRVWSLVAAGADGADIARAAREAIERFEPRVDVVAVEAVDLRTQDPVPLSAFAVVDGSPVDWRGVAVTCALVERTTGEGFSVLVRFVVTDAPSGLLELAHPRDIFTFRRERGTS